MENIEIARRIALEIIESSQLLDASAGISAERIGNIVEAEVGEVNCYPGIHRFGCQSKAYFVSLTSKRNAKGRGHLTFSKAIERLVQHMQGHCHGMTEEAVIICDHYDSEVIDEWRSNINQIKRTATIEAYLITGKDISPIII